MECPRPSTKGIEGQPKGVRALFIDFIQSELSSPSSGDEPTGGKLIEVPKAIRRRRGVGRGANPTGPRRFLLGRRRT